jgi:hypothetical protein
MQAATAETARVGELVEAVEADVALTIAVLRFANRAAVAGGVGGDPEAVDVLKPSGVLAIAGTAPVFDFFESNGGWELQPERFRVHALATQQARRPDRPRDRLGRRDELAVAALLHDIGRLVISSLHPATGLLRRRPRTPEQRIRDEREQLGIDHALVGGVLRRRWNLPQRIAVAIERHHAERLRGPCRRSVALADMVAHYAQGEAVTPGSAASSAKRCGLSPEALREVLYELPCPREDSRDQRALPLSNPRARRPPPPLRGHGLQADRRRDAALGLDDSHPPAQRLTARSAPSTGRRPCSPRATRLDLDALVDQRLAQGDRTACVLLRRTSARETFLVWVLTVSSLRSELAAATAVEPPSASSWRISRWRRVSLPRLPLGGTAGSTKRSCASAAPTACALLGAGRAGDVGAGARPAGRRWRCALGRSPWATMPSRARSCAASDRLVAADRGRRRRSRARMSTIATSKLPMSRISSSASSRVSLS